MTAELVYADVKATSGGSSFSSGGMSRLCQVAVAAEVVGCQALLGGSSSSGGMSGSSRWQ